MLFNSNNNECGKALRAAVESLPCTRGCTIEYFADAGIVSCNSTALGPYLASKLGTTTEAKFSFTYYESGELVMDCYFSRARGIEISSRLGAAIARIPYIFSIVNYAEHVDGWNNAAFTLGTSGVTKANMRSYVANIGESIRIVLENLG